MTKNEFLDTQTAFLAAFSPEQRTMVAAWFRNATQRGARDAEAVLRGICDQVEMETDPRRRALVYARRSWDRRKARVRATQEAVQARIEADRSEALAYAAEVLARYSGDTAG